MKIESGSEVVLDTHAIIAFLLKETGFETVKKLLRRAKRREIRIQMNEINLGEVYYGIWKKSGEEIGKKALEYCLSLPISFVSVDLDFILKAAEFKAQNKISYADAFCIETARSKNCPLITGDPEFVKVPGIKIIWIRK